MANSVLFLQNPVHDLVNQNGLLCLKPLILHSVALLMQWAICPFCLFLLRSANFSCHPLRLKGFCFPFAQQSTSFFSTCLFHSLKHTYRPRQAAAGSHVCHPLIGERECRRRKMTCRHIPLYLQLCSCAFSPPISDGRNEAATNTEQPGRESMIYQMKPALVVVIQAANIRGRKLSLILCLNKAWYLGSPNLAGSRNAAVICRTDSNSPSWK